MTHARTTHETPAALTQYAAALLIGFGLVLVFSAVAYTRDLAALARTPELIWLFLCGLPVDDGVTLPALVVGGTLTVGAGAALLAHQAARTPLGRRLIVAAAVAAPILALGVPRLLPPPAATAPAEPRLVGQPVDPPRPLADWTLTSHTGAPLSLSDLRGRPALIFFGYTRCPDVCPATLAEFKRVQTMLGEHGDALSYVFVSVDGERDPPERLARYVHGFAPSFIGVTGPESDMRRIGADYGLFFEKRTIEGTKEQYLVDHTAAAYLVDAEGRLVMVYPFDTPGKTIAADLREMLGH